MRRGFAGTGRPRRRLARACAALALAGSFVFAAESTQTAIANGDTRTLSFYHTHSHEKITVTFKKDGRYDQSGLKKLNHFLRDWRNQKATTMEPRLFDVVWEVQKDAGSTAPIWIISAFRSPETNEKLRSRSKGVAKNSQHTLGRAMDIHLPDVNMAKIREAGLRLQRGGVGFYPTSAKPFVHLDVGNVRHWPRMTRDQLVRLFPDGRTVHIPSDGKPLKNYELALADVAKNGATVRGMSESQIAAAARNRKNGGSGGGFLAKVFGGDDEEDDAAPAAPAEAAPQAPAAAPVAVAAIEDAIPMPVARPDEVAANGPQLASAYAPQQLPAGPDMIWSSGPDAAAGRAATNYEVPATTPASPIAMPQPRPSGTTPAALVAQPGAVQPAAAQPVMAALGSGALDAQREAARRALSSLIESTIAEPAPKLPASDAAAHIAAAHDAFAPNQTASLGALRRLPQAAPAPAAQTVAYEIRSAETAPASAFSPLRSARNRALGLNPPDADRVAMIAHPAEVLPSFFGGNPSMGMRSDAFMGASIPVLRTVSYGVRQTAQLGTSRF